MLSHISIETRINNIAVSEFAKKHPLAAEQAISELRAELTASMIQTLPVQESVQSILDVQNMTPVPTLQSSHSA